MAFSVRSTLAALSRAAFFSPRTRTRTRTHLQSRPIPTITKPSESDATKRLLCSKPNNIDTKLNFSLSDADSDDDDDIAAETSKEVRNKTLPPPYNPFAKKPTVQEPKDPKDLQEIFHNMRSGEGLMNHAVKMFDELSKQGLTHVALELFAEIKDRGHVPDVVAHTAIVEAYANAGQPKQALKALTRMLASGVSPNAYTYTVLIAGLASGDAKFLKDAKKYLLEMMDKGMRPSVATYTAVFEGLVREEKADEAAELLVRMKGMGFVPDETAVREVMRNKRGPVFRTLMDVLFAK